MNKKDVLWSARTHLKGRPPTFADESEAVDWAIRQGLSYGLVVEKLQKVKHLHGVMWRVHWIEEVARWM